MNWYGVPIHPERASTIARGVDELHYFLTAVTLFFTVVIFLTIFYFAIKYRRRSTSDTARAQIEGSLKLELTWTLIPMCLTGVMFFWGSSLYFRNARPPAASIEIFVVGKQWMWHLQHPEGPREINELHVPVSVPVKLTMTSEDVIHDFYVPAFRVKKDVLPGRYSSIWFQATKTGAYHFFCAQYCGAEHSGMIGWVHVMTATDYAQWLSGGVKGESMAAAGNRLFAQLGCVTCHLPDGTGRGPSLVGLFGKPVKLLDGRTLTADETFIREAILHPNSKPIPGYPPVMPSFQGQIDEQQLLQLVTYVKSLGTEQKKPTEERRAKK